MRRVLFQWRGIKIYAYPALLYVGVVCGVLGGSYAATRHGLDASRIGAAMLLLVLPALVGARLLYVAAHWPVFRRQPRRIWSPSEGGAALYGGLVLAFLLSLPLLRALGISVGAFWDATTLTLLIGMIFTRVGCLLNGCCAGRPAHGPLALYLPNVNGVWCRRLPSQLFEAGLAVVLLLGSVLAWDRLPFDGALFLGNVAAYALARWGLELTRESSDRVGGVRLSGAISVGLVLLSAGSFLVISLLGSGRYASAAAGLPQAPAFAVGSGMDGWSVLLTPVAVLVVLLLFRFVGCTSFGSDDVSNMNLTDDYAKAVAADNPIAYWRLQEKMPVPPALPSGVTAANAVGVASHLHDGLYNVAPAPIPPDPVNHHGGANPIKLELGVIPGLLEKDTTATAIRVQGGFVRVPWTADLNPPQFSVDALVLPEWDLSKKGFFYTFLSSTSQSANTGYAIYGGPLDDTDPQSEYHWQLWVGNGTTFEQLKLKDFMPNGTGGLKYTGTEPGRQNDPGLKIVSQPTYLALTREVTVTGGATFFFHFFHSGRDMSWLRYELLPLSSGSFAPNITPADLFIGIDGPFAGPIPFNDAFSGKIEEVAIYNGAVPDMRLSSHGMAAFKNM
jgi:phosphatidylglycerol:prolipoprotein diacylglycerol transferase